MDKVSETARLLRKTGTYKSLMEQIQRRINQPHIIDESDFYLEMEQFDAVITDNHWTRSEFAKQHILFGKELSVAHEPDEYVNDTVDWLLTGK